MTDRLIHVPVARLRHGPNVRERADEGLVASIREHGILQPITVAKAGDGYEVLIGHRRATAARKLRLEIIPALLVYEVPADLALRQLVENLDRKAMDPIDVAEALRAELAGHPDLTQTALAKRMGRAPGWVSRKLDLLDLDSEERGRLSRGEITEQQAHATRMATSKAAPTGRPRLLEVDQDSGRSRSVIVPLGGANATIGVDLNERTVDLVVQDLRGRGVMVTLDPESARLLSRRLAQAVLAVAS